MSAKPQHQNATRAYARSVAKNDSRRLFVRALMLTAFAACLFACGAGAQGAGVRFAPASADLDPTGLKLTVKNAVLDGRADGTVVLHDKTLMIFSKTEARVPANGPTAPSILLFTVSGDKVEGNGKSGAFNATNDVLTFNGLSIAIRDGVPEVLLSGYRIPTKMKFDALPAQAKRAGLILVLFILAVSQHLDDKE